MHANDFPGCCDNIVAYEYSNPAPSFFMESICTDKRYSVVNLFHFEVVVSSRLIIKPVPNYRGL